jgi:hypothetical protein
MGNPTHIRMGGRGLSDVRVIMTIMHVVMVKSLCQVVMERVPVLECMLLGTRGHPRLRPIMPSVKGHCIMRTRLQWLYSIVKRP